jgi:hypothetical protein
MDMRGFRVATLKRPEAIRTFAAMATVGLCVCLFAGHALAATRTAPAKQHQWHQVGAPPENRVEARACTDCPAALELRCLGGPGSGLMELALPVAGVANGREQATKQMRLIAGGHVMQRRATTLRRGGLFVPHVALGADDILFSRLERADLLELSFYGQRAYVGLGADGQRAIHDLRAACWPDLKRPEHRTGDAAICTWHVPLGCYQTEAAAQGAGQVEAVRVLLARRDTVWCASAVIEDLGAARIFAGKRQTYPRRACVWVAARSQSPGDASPNLAPANPINAPRPGAR